MLPFTFEAPEPSVVSAVEGCKVKRQGTTGQLKVLSFCRLFDAVTCIDVRTYAPKSQSSPSFSQSANPGRSIHSRYGVMKSLFPGGNPV